MAYAAHKGSSYSLATLVVGLLVTVVLPGCGRGLFPPTTTAIRAQRPASSVSQRTNPAPSSPATFGTNPAAPDPDVQMAAPTDPDPQQTLRDRFFSEFPDGSGWLALGILPVPVRVTRRGDTLEVWAPGFGATITHAPDGLSYQEGSAPPAHLARIAASSTPEGTRYELWMDSGKHLTAVFLRDGQSLRWEDKSIRLN